MDARLEDEYDADRQEENQEKHTQRSDEGLAPQLPHYGARVFIPFQQAGGDVEGVEVRAHRRQLVGYGRDGDGDGDGPRGREAHLRLAHQAGRFARHIDLETARLLVVVRLNAEQGVAVPSVGDRQRHSPGLLAPGDGLLLGRELADGKLVVRVDRQERAHPAGPFRVVGRGHDDRDRINTGATGGRAGRRDGDRRPGPFSLVQIDLRRREVNPALVDAFYVDVERGDDISPVGDGQPGACCLLYVDAPLPLRQLGHDHVVVLVGRRVRRTGAVWGDRSSIVCAAGGLLALVIR